MLVLAVKKSHPDHSGWFFVWEKATDPGISLSTGQIPPLLMPRLLYFLLVITVITLAAACSKDSDNPEAAFYGTWVKGSNTGDTLYFYRKYGRDIMRSNQSFNPGMNAPFEQEFRYINGKLAFQPAWSGGLQYHPIESFTWKTPGREFEINGFELYMFMSSTMTKFTFTKIP